LIERAICPMCFLVVLPRIARIEFQSINRLVNNSRQTVARLIAAIRDQVRSHVLRSSSAVAALAAFFGAGQGGRIPPVSPIGRYRSVL
jgi:hypothetical protein